MLLSDQYAAGFFDGEGCVSLTYCNRRFWRSDPSKKMRSFRFVITISNTNARILRMFHDRFGGQFYAEKLRLHNRKQVHHWRIASNAVAQCAFLTAIRPHSIVKAEQIDIGLEYLTTSVGVGKRLPQEFWDTRIRCLERMAVLNKRGDWKVHLTPLPATPHKGNTMGKPARREPLYV